MWYIRMKNARCQKKRSTEGKMVYKAWEWCKTSASLIETLEYEGENSGVVDLEPQNFSNLPSSLSTSCLFFLASFALNCRHSTGTYRTVLPSLLYTLSVQKKYKLLHYGLPRFCEYCLKTGWEIFAIGGSIVMCFVEWEDI